MVAIVVCKWVEREREKQNKIILYYISNKWEFWIPLKMDRPGNKSLNKQKRDLGHCKIHSYSHMHV